MKFGEKNNKYSRVLSHVTLPDGYSCGARVSSGEGEDTASRGVTVLGGG